MTETNNAGKSPDELPHHFPPSIPPYLFFAFWRNQGQTSKISKYVQTGGKSKENNLDLKALGTLHHLAQATRASYTPTKTQPVLAIFGPFFGVKTSKFSNCLQTGGELKEITCDLTRHDRPSPPTGWAGPGCGFAGNLMPQTSAASCTIWQPKSSAPHHTRDLPGTCTPHCTRLSKDSFPGGGSFFRCRR